MSVRFSTSFRGKLPFQIRDIFCQYTYLSHLYRNVAKVPKYSMRVRNLPDHRLVSRIRLVEGKLHFAFFFSYGLVVFVCVSWYGAFGYVNVCP